MDQNTVRQIFELLGFLYSQLLDVVEQLQDFLVRATRFFAVVLALHVDRAFNIKEGQRAEERSSQKFPAALFAVQINVKQVACVKLRLIP